MKTKTEIVQIVKQELLRRTEIQFAYIFGSFAGTGSFRDIDIGIYLMEVSNSVRQSYDTQLALMLERAINLPVDVVVMNTAPDRVIHRISAGLLVVDRIPGFRADASSSLGAIFRHSGKARSISQRKRDDIMSQRSNLDVERITSLVSVARNALGELSGYQELEEAQLLSSSEKLGNIKYQFIVAVEACVDICNHIAEFLNSAAALATGSV